MRRISCSLACSLALLALGCSDTTGGGPVGPAVDADTSGDAAVLTDAADDEGAPPDVEADPGITPDPGVTDEGADLADAGATDEGVVADPGTPDPGAPDEGPGDVAVIPTPDVVFDPSRCSAPGGGVNIYDIQSVDCPDHPSPEPVGTNGLAVALDGVIVTAVFDDTLFVQEPQGGPYSGLAVFSHGLPTMDLMVGDVIDLTGGYSEFFDTTQVYLEAWTVVGSAPEPEPYVAAHPSHLATDGPLAEMFEGVLVRVLDVATTHTQPDCPYDYGEFEVTGNLRIDDMADALLTWNARLGDTFTSITGPLQYSFGNHKIEPRSDADIDWTNKGSETAISKCLASECQVTEGQIGTRQVIVTEFLPDPFGADGGLEWIELYNPGDTIIDISGWSLRSCGELAVELVDGASFIPSGGFLVIGASGSASVNGGAGVAMAYGQDFYLPNTVGSILLFDGPQFGAQLVDQVRYSAFPPWDSIWWLGRSLERIDPLGSGLDASNFAPGSGTYGPTDNQGTPGGANSVW